MKRKSMKKLLALILALSILALVGCDYEGNPNSSSDNPDIPGLPEATVWKIGIERVYNVLQGHYRTVAVTADFDSTAIGGFDLMIAYDAEALVFVEAELGEYGATCDWEYFTYRFGYMPDCGDNCPHGLLHLIGLAETNNGAHHPDYECLAEGGRRTLAMLTFYTNTDHVLEGTVHPINFYWIDCGDNVVSNVYGDTLALNRHVYNYKDSLIESSIAELPGYWGAPDDPCMLGDKWQPIRYVDFYDGVITFPGGDSVDSRGDINNNGIPFEIADAVMYANYFVMGAGAFGTHVEASIAASDANDDGQTLTVADLVYMARIIDGDAVPSPLPAATDTVDVYAQNGYISTASPVDIGGGLFIFDIKGDYGDPTLHSNDMDIFYDVLNGQLRVLIFNLEGGYIPAGQSLVLSVPGAVKLVSAELSTYEGAMLPSEIHQK